MKLNRERIAAGLGLLLLVFGAYKILWSRITDSPPAISTEIPTIPDEVPRVEPRLYTDDVGGDRNPFLLASDWAPMTPEPLDPPAVDPTRWFALSLGKSPDPAEVGFVYPLAPPQEIGGGEDGGDAEKPAPRAPAAEPAPAGKAAPGEGAAPAPGGAASGAAGKVEGGKKAAPGEGVKEIKVQKKGLKLDARRGNR